MGARQGGGKRDLVGGRASAFAIMAAMAVTLAGCTSHPAPRLEPLRFEQLGTVAFDAATVQIVDEYRSPMTAPNVEHRAPTPLMEATHRWVAEHFHATGTSGTIQVIIRDARMIETQLPRTEGVAAVFTTDQSQRYDGRLEIRITGQSPRTGFSGYVQATAARSATVAEDISLAAREQAWNMMVQTLISDVSVQLDRGLRDNMRPMLRH
jgi:hypothetical protein